MGHRVALALLAAQSALWALGCARREVAPRPAAAPASWLLLTPPEIRDEGFPRGVRLLPDAPIREWQRQAEFDSEEACEGSRRTRTDDAIDRARAAYGDAAKLELPVRRAVNARCVRADALPAAGPPPPRVD
jgi:hypothetical protein